MGNVIRYGNKYRCAETGVPAYAEALGVRHLGEMRYVRVVGGRLIFLPPDAKTLTAVAPESARPEPVPTAAKRAAEMRDAPTSSLVHGLFTPVDRQADIISGWGASCSWLGGTRAWFEKTLMDARERARRTRWPGSRLTAVVLVPTLAQDSFRPGYINTLIFLLNRIKCVAENAGIEFLEGPLAKAAVDTVRIAGTVRDTLKPGIRVEVIDLGAMSGMSLWRIAANQMPHAGILAAAALHPQWLMNADGVSDPFVIMANYQLQIRGAPPWQRVPSLGRPVPNKLAITSHDVNQLPPANGFKWALPQFISRI